MFGGDIELKDQAMIISGRLSWLSSKYSSFVTLSMFSSIMLLYKATLSTDPFVMVDAFQGGIALTTVIFGLVIAFSMISFSLFEKCWVACGSMSYKGVWNACFGSKISWIPSILVIISYFTFMSICTTDLKDDMSFVFKTIDQEKWNQYSKIVVYLIIGFTGIPSLISVSFSVLLYISIIGNVGLITGCIIVAAKCVINIRSFGINPEKKAIWWNWDIQNIVTSFSYINSAFFSHPIIYMVIIQITNPTKRSANKIFLTNLSITSLTIYITGLCGYLIAFDNIGDHTLLTYLPPSLEISIARIGAMMSNLGSSCAFCLFVTKELCDMILDMCHKSTHCRVLSVIIAILCSYAFSMTQSGIQEIVWIIGSFSYYSLVFLLPPLYYLKVFEFRNKIWSIIAALIMVMCIPLSSLDIYYSITSLLSN